MRQEKAKKLLPIIQGIAEGKQLQFSFNGVTWIDETDKLELKTIVDDICADSCDYRIKSEAVHTNCKDCGSKICALKGQNKNGCENWHKEKQYRPFNDCNELIEHYQKKYKSAVGCDIYFPSLYKPCIWIRDKTEDAKGDIELITGFTEHGNVLINGTSYPLQHLFQMYEFLDGTPVGVEE